MVIHGTSHEIRTLVHGDITDSVSVTIGTNEQEADSVIVAIRENNKPEEIRVLVHRREQQAKRSGYWSKASRNSRQCQLTIDNELDKDKTDSAIEAIGTNETKNSQQRHDDHRYKLQEWQCYCSHHRKWKQSGQCHGDHPYHQQLQESTVSR
jgi:hypothetical protein